MLRQLLCDAVQQGELDFVLQELPDVGAEALRRLQHCCSDDVDVQVPCVMAPSHVHVHLMDSTAQSGVTILL